MLTSILHYVGLDRPYRFERAIPTLLAIVLMIVVIAVAGWLAATDRLIAGGPRGYYFLYLLSLLVLTIALARWPWVAAVPLVLCLVDLSWGCLLYTSPSPRDRTRSRMPSSA